MPTGGTTGQVLAKASNANYATEWVAAGASTNLFVANGDPFPAVVNGAVLHVYDPDEVLS